MTPSHYPDEETNVRVIDRAPDGGGVAYIEERRERTPQERHREDARTQALDEASKGAAALSESIGWAESVGIEIPLKVKGMETTLRQWIRALEDEER